MFYRLCHRKSFKGPYHHCRKCRSVASIVEYELGENFNTESSHPLPGSDNIVPPTSYYDNKLFGFSSLKSMFDWFGGDIAIWERFYELGMVVRVYTPFKVWQGDTQALALKSDLRRAKKVLTLDEIFEGILAT